MAIVVGIVVAAIVLFIGLPWLAGVLFYLRVGDWKGAWKAFCGRLD